MTTPLALHSPSSLTHSLSGRYHLFEQVGIGGYCTIHRAWDAVALRIVAVKRLRAHLPDSYQSRAMYQLQHEAHMLATLSHPVLPCLYEHDAEGAALILSYIDGPSLASILQSHRRGLPFSDIFFIGRSLCHILSYLHQQQIIFCDLSASNVLISEGCLFLVDFGLAHRVNSARSKILLGLGTRGYAAPELYPGAHSGITFASDIYSLGALLHYLCSGKDPTCLSSPFYFSSLPARIPSGLSTLIWAMLDPEPRRRPPLLTVSQSLEAKYDVYL
jgi:serine/threonine protein kinase